MKSIATNATAAFLPKNESDVRRSAYASDDAFIVETTKSIARMLQRVRVAVNDFSSAAVATFIALIPRFLL
ncbi:MAG: hypothetical protein K2X64_00395 [Rhodocyclaceae bacterium]|nr:hypothetical protein [Rhodocyclaceae bacterium]